MASSDCATRSQSSFLWTRGGPYMTRLYSGMCVIIRAKSGAPNQRAGWGGKLALHRRHLPLPRLRQTRLLRLLSPRPAPRPHRLARNPRPPHPPLLRQRDPQPRLTSRSLRLRLPQMSPRSFRVPEKPKTLTTSRFGGSLTSVLPVIRQLCLMDVRIPRIQPPRWTVGSGWP